MKTKKILSAVFWISLYIAAAYFYWAIAFPSMLSETRSRPDDQGLPFPIVSALIVLIVCAFSDISKRINPSNEKLAFWTLVVSSIVSPFWWVLLGIVWLLIRAVKNLVVFIKTTQWI